MKLEKIGAIAALALGVGFLVLMGLLMTLAGQGYTPGSGNDPAKALEFAANSPLPYIIYWLYAGFAVLVVMIVKALGSRFGSAADKLMRFALLAAGLTCSMFLLYAVVGLVGEPMIVRAYMSSPTEAQAMYLTLRAAMNIANTSAIFACGLAIVLAGWAALQTKGLPKLLAYLLLLAGALSMLAVILPPLSLIAPLLYIVWSIWLGIVMLQPSKREPVQIAAPAL